MERVEVSASTRWFSGARPVCSYLEVSTVRDYPSHSFAQSPNIIVVVVVFTWVVLLLSHAYIEGPQAAPALADARTPPKLWLEANTL